MNTYKQHPISMTEGIWKSVIVLIFPLMRGLLAASFDVYTWVTGAWFDIVIVASILLYAFLRFKSKSCCVHDGYLSYRSGVILRQVGDIPVTMLTTVSMRRPLLYRFTNAVIVKAETDMGPKNLPDVTITLNGYDAAELEDLLKKHNVNVTKRYYTPKAGYLVLYSLLNSSTFSGILLISAFFSQTGAVVGRKIQDDVFYTLNDISVKVALGIPPIAITISIVLLSGWLIGFIFNVANFLRFTIRRTNDHLVIDKGIVAKRRYLINCNRIVYVDLRQTLITKLFSVSSAYIYCSGYGKGKNEAAVLIPATSKNDMQSSMKMLLPEFEAVKPGIRPRPAALMSYCINTIYLIAAIPIVCHFAAPLFPNFAELIYFSAVIAEIPCVWHLAAKIFAFFTSGIGENGEHLILKYSKGFSFHSLTVCKSKISAIRIMRNPFNLMSGRCTMCFYTYGEKIKSHRIKGISYACAREFVEKFGSAE
ncbi:MAG: PH domain-containing protein [Oscillospiraceae bacterium]